MLRPQLWLPLALTCVNVTPAGCCTETGYFLVRSELLPSAPSPAYPQNHACPVVSSAQLCVYPATICENVTPAGCLSVAGVVCQTEVLSPSWP